jgi:hypothetical protein
MAVPPEEIPRLGIPLHTLIELAPMPGERISRQCQDMPGFRVSKCYSEMGAKYSHT